MPNLNRTMVMGRLTHDARLRHDDAGQAVLEWSVAVNKNFRGQDGQRSSTATFLDFAILGKRAEGLAPHLKKGVELYIDGEIQVWNNDDGAKWWVIVANDIEFLSKKPEGVQNGRGQ